MSRLAEQDDPRIAYPLQQRADVGLLDVCDWLGRLADQLGDRPGTAALSRWALAFGDPRIPTLCSNQPDELNLAKILIIELVPASPSNSNQTLQSRGIACRYDEAAANGQLFEQWLWHLRAAGCYQDHSKFFMATARSVFTIWS